MDLGQEPGDLVVLSFTDSDLAGIGAGPCRRARAAEPAPRQARQAAASALGRPLRRARGGAREGRGDPLPRRARLLALRRRALRRGGAGARRRRWRCCRATTGPIRGSPPSPPTPISPRGLDAYFRAGGPENLRRMLRLLAARIGADCAVEPPEPLPRGFPWCPGCGVLPLDRAVAAAASAVPLAGSPRRTHPWPCSLIYRPPCWAAIPRRPSRSPRPCARAGSACCRWRCRA